MSASNDPVRAGQVQVERGACPTAGFRLRPGQGEGRDGAQWEQTGRAYSHGRSPRARRTLAPPDSRPTLCPARLAGSVLPLCCPQAQAHTGTIWATVRLCEGRGGPSVLARLLWVQAGPCSQATTGSSPFPPVSSCPSRTSGLAQDTSGNDGHGGQQGDQQATEPLSLHVLLIE